MTDSQILDLAQIAYEARFEGMTLGPRGVAPAWADLGPEARAVWQRIADEVVAAHVAGGANLDQAKASTPAGLTAIQETRHDR